jgi:hypothetical protein
VLYCCVLARSAYKMAAVVGGLSGEKWGVAVPLNVSDDMSPSSWWTSVALALCYDAVGFIGVCYRLVVDWIVSYCVSTGFL